MVIRWARASWLRAGEFFASDGVTVEQVMTDNAFAYRNAEVFQGARTRCAAGRLRGFGVDPPSGRPPAERARRADPTSITGWRHDESEFWTPTRLLSSSSGSGQAERLKEICWSCCGSEQMHPSTCLISRSSPIRFPAEHKYQHRRTKERKDLKNRRDLDMRREDGRGLLRQFSGKRKHSTFDPGALPGTRSGAKAEIAPHSLAMLLARSRIETIPTTAFPSITGRCRNPPKSI